VTTYIDSSVLVRIVAGQERPLEGWESIVSPLASALIEVETPRAIDRLRRDGELTEPASVHAWSRGREALRAFRLMEIDPAVRFRAGGPFALPVRSLDAVHLASALLWREAHPDEELIMATHDERLARTAQAHGLSVIGWPD
jgi:predicted nucleic acid-binding protein